MKVALLAAAVVFLGILAAEGQTTRPTTVPTGLEKPTRLTLPWSKIASLSEEKRKQIAAVHRRALDEMKAIRERERAEIVELLSDEQKRELKAVMEAETVKKKLGKGKGETQGPKDE